MNQAVLKKIADLAEEIYADAATLDKTPRYMISDLATLIRWIAFEAQNPGEPEATAAIERFRRALCLEPPPPTLSNSPPAFIMFLGLAAIASSLFAIAGHAPAGIMLVGALVVAAVFRSYR